MPFQHRKLAVKIVNYASKSTEYLLLYLCLVENLLDSTSGQIVSLETRKIQRYWFVFLKLLDYSSDPYMIVECDTILYYSTAACIEMFPGFISFFENGLF